MKDETYSFISDVKEKGVTARSARNMRSHTGKGGRCRLPHDNISKKELKEMSGEVKSYRLNDPMDWEEFKSMPDDLKVAYIKLLRKKFKAPDCKIGEMMGVNKHIMSAEVKRIGLGHGEKHGGHRGWDKDGFYAWKNGVDKLPTPVIEEPAEDPAQEEPENFAEEDIPWIDPEPIQEIYKPIPMTAVPTNGSMTFKCPANMALNTLKEVLANEMVELSIMWRVVEEMSGEA